MENLKDFGGVLVFIFFSGKFPQFSVGHARSESMVLYGRYGAVNWVGDGSRHCWQCRGYNILAQCTHVQWYHRPLLYIHTVEHTTIFYPYFRKILWSNFVIQSVINNEVKTSSIDASNVFFPFLYENTNLIWFHPKQIWRHSGTRKHSYLEWDNKHGHWHLIIN